MPQFCGWPFTPFPQGSVQVMVSVVFSCHVSLFCFNWEQFHSPFTDFYDMSIFEDYRAGVYL